MQLHRQRGFVTLGDDSGPNAIDRRLQECSFSIWIERVRDLRASQSPFETLLCWRNSGGSALAVGWY
jgi:hypothetical protein